MLIHKDGKFYIDLEEANAGCVEGMMHSVVNVLMDSFADNDKMIEQNNTDTYFMLLLLKSMLPSEKQIDAYAAKGFCNTEG